MGAKVSGLDKTGSEQLVGMNGSDQGCAE